MKAMLFSFLSMFTLLYFLENIFCKIYRYKNKKGCPCFTCKIAYQCKFYEERSKNK